MSKLIYKEAKDIFRRLNVLKYFVNLKINNQNVDRIYPYEGNTNASALSKLIKYFIEEGYTIDDISDTGCLVANDNMVQDDLVVRVNDAIKKIKEMYKSGIFLSVDPTEPDSLYYVKTSDIESTISILDSEAVILVMKSALDTVLNIKSIGASIKLCDKGILLLHDKSKNNIVIDEISEELRLKQTQIKSMQSFLDNAGAFGPLRYNN